MLHPGCRALITRRASSSDAPDAVSLIVPLPLGNKTVNSHVDCIVFLPWWRINIIGNEQCAPFRFSAELLYLSIFNISGQFCQIPYAATHAMP